MFNAKNILITGGTGSFGQAFVPYLLKKYKPKKLIVFSRDEMKQWEMKKKFQDVDNLRFFIGDVRDYMRLVRALEDVDFVVHAAATKIVPTAEYNPFECVKTNINGAMNVIDASIDNKVKRVVALSTDKASNPVNLYGATKLASDKLFIAANSYSKPDKTKFSLVRYGNVMGSRGSIIPYFLSLKEKNVFPVTDENMTRFMISLEQGIELVLHAFKDMVGGEIYVKKIPSMNILEIVRAISKKAKIDIIGIRPGEKLHEQMIGLEDASFTYEYEDYFKILPSIHNWSEDPGRIGEGKLVPKDFKYSSDTNKQWMTSEELQMFIKKNL